MLAPLVSCAFRDEATLVCQGWLPTLESAVFAQARDKIAGGYSYPSSAQQFDLISLFPIPDVPSVLRTLYAGDGKRAPSALIKLVVDSVFHLAALKNWAKIDELLGTARPDLLAPELLVVMIRSTATLSGKLPSWIQFRNDVSNELSLRGYDAKRVLAGLGDGGVQGEPSR